jgi:predicted aspartyl protease
MGITYTTIKIRNPLINSEKIELEAKVDNGATLLVLPGSIVEKLQFPEIRKQTVKNANEDTAERSIVAGVEVEICGRKGWFEAVVEPKKVYALVGAVLMETLDLIVEPRDFGVYPNPRAKLPMAEIE